MEGGGDCKSKGTLSCSVTVQKSSDQWVVGRRAREGAELRAVGRILLCSRRVRAPEEPPPRVFLPQTVERI